MSLQDILGQIIGQNGGLTLSSPGSVGAFPLNTGVEAGNALAGINARSDPLLSFLWYAQVPLINPIGLSQTASDIVNGLTAGVAGALGGNVSSSLSAQLPWYYIEEVQCPFRHFEEMTIFREGRNRRYPSKYSVDSLGMHFYADTDNKSLQYLQAWQNAVIAPFNAGTQIVNGGHWGRPSDYKKPIYIYLLDSTRNVLCVIEYIECWPMNVSTFNMTSNSSDRLVHQVTMNVGDVFIYTINLPSNITQSIFNNPFSNQITQGITSNFHLPL